MPPSVSEATSRLAAAIPLSKAAAWDAVGLQVGDPAAAMSRVAVCHEVTSEVVSAALEAGTNLLVAYHPLLFRPAGSFTAGDSAAGRAFRLAAGGVALYVVHTAFDVVKGGCADALAEVLGLSHIAGFGTNWPADSAKIVAFAEASVAPSVAAAMAEAGATQLDHRAAAAFSIERAGTESESMVRIEVQAAAHRVESVVAALVAAHPGDAPAFDVSTARSNAGFVGRIGDLDSPESLSGFTQSVIDQLGAYARFAGGDREIHRVAVVPGSGSDLIGAAIGAGADVLVTGDMSHHRANGALERGLAIIDAGHAATERPGVARLYSLASKMFDEVADLTHIDPSPWGGV